MNCPNCGVTEQARVRVCKNCGATYASQDLLEYRQIEYLLNETKAWHESAARRAPYANRLANLRARILPAPSAPVTTTPVAAIPTPAPTPPPAPKIERPAVPFDQWLLSERNIKIALYSGGVLLVLAGLVFVGINWERLTGALKIAVTLLITALMYAGGALLFRRPLLKLGGVALLGVASGFAPLNFAVLQIYVVDPRVISHEMMWLIASVVCLALYVLTAFLTRNELFTFFGIAAVLNGATAALLQMRVGANGIWLMYALILLICLLGARLVQAFELASYTRRPLLVASHLTMPFVFLVNTALAMNALACTRCDRVETWLSFVAMIVGAMFYTATDLLWQRLAARWASAVAFALTLVLILGELRFDTLQTGIVLKVVALLYLGGGHLLERRANARAHGAPLYVTGYGLALLVTLQATTAFAKTSEHLALALIADVILISLSAWMFRDFRWMYGAAWLLIAPVWIYAEIYLRGGTNQGLVLGALMLAYNALGFALGRRALNLAMPFLSAAAFLSFLVVALLWSNAVVVSIALVIIAALYALNALWRRQPFLLLPSLGAINLAVFSSANIGLPLGENYVRAISVAFAGLTAAFVAAAFVLNQVKARGWIAPFYLFAAVNMAGAYSIALFFGRELAIGTSVLFSALALWLAWTERDFFARYNLPPVMTYAGAGLLAVGAYFTSDALGFRNLWSVGIEAVCAIYVLSALAFEGDPFNRIYGTPLRIAGLGLLIVPLVGTLGTPPLQGALTFGIAAFVLFLDGAARRAIDIAYLGIAAGIVMLWHVLEFLVVRELQAYALPAGIAWLAIGWNERRRGKRARYQVATFLGLGVLMGTAFQQSLGSVGYSVLLLAESILALAWGIRARTRGYVQIAILSLVANAVAQFGPAFGEMPRWIQLGTIGTLLLGGGLGALFRREQIINARKTFASRWESWDA